MKRPLARIRTVKIFSGVPHAWEKRQTLSRPLFEPFVRFLFGFQAQMLQLVWRREPHHTEDGLVHHIRPPASQDDRPARWLKRVIKDFIDVDDREDDASFLT